MRLQVENPGLLTTVQDLGRWGYQAQGVSVAGAMDIPALKLGNILLGNEPGAAALEITLLGPTLVVLDGGFCVLTGADLGARLDGVPLAPWTVFSVSASSRISFSGKQGDGCRAYLCVAGGIDVPLVMGSRSTYTRGALGGIEGRALKRGDLLISGELPPLAAKGVGLTLPQSMRPDMGNAPLAVLVGLQSDAFTEKGLQTFFNSEYRITQESDRMGCRFEGPSIEHREGTDIISDAVTLGAIQVPGHGQPIAMLADRQTTGGYAKLGVLSPMGLGRLVQRCMGESVTFKKLTQQEGVEELRSLESLYAKTAQLRAAYRSREELGPRHYSISVSGNLYRVTVESL